MLLQTNSYVVLKEKRAEHARLMRRFRQSLSRLGCDSFEVYEQVGANWSGGASTGRFVQIMRFRDRKHQLAVQNAERNDPHAQEIIAEFCQMVNYTEQVQQNLFAVGFYSSVLPVAPVRVQGDLDEPEHQEDPGGNGVAHEPGALGSSPDGLSEPMPQDAEVELDLDAFTNIEDDSGSSPPVPARPQRKPPEPSDH